MITLSTQIPWVERFLDFSLLSRSCQDFPLHPKTEAALRESIAHFLGLTYAQYEGPLTSTALEMVEDFRPDHRLRDAEAWILYFLPNVQRASLSGSLIDDARYFLPMKKLRDLDISRTRIYDLRPLLELKALRSLDIEGSRALIGLDRATDQLSWISDTNSWGWHRYFYGCTMEERAFGQALQEAFVDIDYDDMVEISSLGDCSREELELIFMGHLFFVDPEAIASLLDLLALLHRHFSVSLEMMDDLYELPDVSLFAARYVHDIRECLTRE